LFAVGELDDHRIGGLPVALDEVRFATEHEVASFVLRDRRKDPGQILLDLGMVGDFTNVEEAIV
jgi:hypothetical protein